MKKASKNNSYHYNKELQPYANELKSHLTKGEISLWKNILSGKQMKGYQFRMCRPVLTYIADFICRELLLIIEIDGISPYDAFAHPIHPKRAEELAQIGFTVLRFSEWEVLNKQAAVAQTIEKWITKHAIGAASQPKAKKRNVRIVLLAARLT